MKRLILILTALSLLGQAGCRTQSVPQATEQFCASLQAFDTAVMQLEQVTPDSTVGEVRRMRNDVTRAWRDVSRSARNLAEAQTKAIDDAWRNLERTIDSVSRRDTLAEAAANIAASADQVRAAVDGLGDLTCPELARPSEPEEATTAGETSSPLPTPAPDQTATAQPKPPSLARVYSGQIPPSNGAGYLMTLTLHPDSSASMVVRAEPADEGSAQAVSEVINQGSWTEHADGTLHVTLDRSLDGTALDYSESFTFAMQDGELVAVDYDAAIYGAGSLTLKPASEATAGSESAEPAAPAMAPETPTAAPATAVPAQPAALTGVVWFLQRMEQGSVGVTTIPDLSQHTLTMRDDGTADATGECSLGAGVYQVEGARISFAVDWVGGPCPQSSLDRQYATYLDFANAFAIEDETLTIFYNNSAGRMIFLAGSQ